MAQRSGNLGRADTYGLETALAIGVSRFVPLLPDINLSYTYLQTEIKKGIVTSATIAGNVPVNIAGNELPYAPQHTLTIGLAKQIGDSLRMRADMRFVDEVFTDFENLKRTYNRGDNRSNSELHNFQCERRLQSLQPMEGLCHR